MTRVWHAACEVRRAMHRAAFTALATALAACLDIPSFDSSSDAGDGATHSDGANLNDASHGDGAITIDGGADAPDSSITDSGCSPNVLTDTNNCGRCGHACDPGTTCSNGVCAPFALRNGGGEISGLRLVGGVLYWMEGGTSLYGCAAPDCSTSSLVPIVTGAPLLGFAVAGTTAYTVEGLEPKQTSHPRWVKSYSTTTPGSATYLTYGDSVNGLYGLEGPIDVDATEVWFFPWANGGPQEFGSVYRSDVGVSSFAHVATTDVAPAVMLRLAVLGGSQYAFWTESTRVVRVRTIDMASTSVMAQGSGFGGLAVDSSYLFFTSETDNNVYRCDALSDCSTKRTIASSQNRASRVAVDAQRIAWTCRGSGADGVVSECAYPDCADGPFILATQQTSPHEIVMDAKYVYWAAGSNLYRVPR